MDDTHSTTSPQGISILGATILASGMAFLIGSSVSIALPNIQSFFDAAINDILWIVNAYILMLAVLILISGTLGDAFGRKKIFLIGIGIFTLGAAISALAGSIKQLILFQAVQGVGAAMMIPGSLAIINISIHKKERGRAIGLWAGLSGALAAFGPFVGGWLIDAYSWRAVFAMIVPLGMISFVFALLHVPESKNTGAHSIDWAGAVLLGVGLFGLSFGLIQGPVAGWGSALVLLGLIGGSIALIVFAVQQVKSECPLIPPALLINPLVLGANIITFFLYFALNGIIFFLVLNFRQIQEYSATFTGIALLPPTVIIAFFSGWAGSLADKIGPRLQMILGPFLVTLGVILMMIPGPNTSYTHLFLPALVLFGGGMALVIAPLTKSALSVREKYSGAASGINNAVSRIAALMAIAVLGAVIVSVFTVQLNNNLEQSQVPSEYQNKILAKADRLAGIELSEEIPLEIQPQIRSIIEQSFVASFRWVMGICATLSFLSVLIAYFFIHNAPVAEGTFHYRKHRHHLL